MDIQKKLRFSLGLDLNKLSFNKYLLSAHWVKSIARLPGYNGEEDPNSSPSSQGLPT